MNDFTHSGRVILTRIPDITIIRYIDNMSNIRNIIFGNIIFINMYTVKDERL
jgi:hypothetical protein